MGTGKSTVGKLLAALLGYDFVDTDAVIEERFGPIPEIFATHGEAAFRAREAEVALELSDRDGLVIGTGGGLMLQEASAQALDRTGAVFCLVASVDTIVARITHDMTTGAVDRPLLAGDDSRQKVADLLKQRAGAYGRFTQVDTERRTAAEVAAEIAQLLRS